MKIGKFFLRHQYRRVVKPEGQSGMNMADLMMWLVIAALIIAAALQAIGSYQKGAYIYQMKNDLNGAVSLATANGTYAGTINEADVQSAVNGSNKSAGVTLTWGIIAATSTTVVAAGPQDSAPLASFRTGGLHNGSIVSIANAAKMTIRPAITGTEGANSSYVLVAHHAKVPDIEVIYFFDSVGSYNSGLKILPTQPDMEIAAGPEVYWVGGDEIYWSPTVSGAGNPAPSATSSPTANASAPVTPVPTSSSPAPTGTSAPSTPAPTTSPNPSPTSSPTTTVAPVGPPPPAVTPAENLDPSNKKFLFCHDGAMHSNSYNGMVMGHSNHPDDIIPPVPPQNYPGHNWNDVTARTFYNKCIPVS